MSLVVAAAPAVPLNSTAGHYVAAAYIVVLAVILIYVAIMATRAQRLERELEQLRRDVEAAGKQEAPENGADPVLTTAERKSVAGRLTTDPVVASPDGERGQS